ncbi:hypothetical protein ILUMI_14727 [Ignelater luminosus]|uniref:Uncharacterized protein n=1 Tax=Ignelater luminosus TaxID=2038154 RepID=A0A8K0CUE2_IGNLU|nr:hypothetical protein ILUMI_14727 [Ignelater luminosus]
MPGRNRVFLNGIESGEERAFALIAYKIKRDENEAVQELHAFIEVEPDTKLRVYDNLEIVGKSKLNVGDTVNTKCVPGRLTFNWSTELFKIVKKQFIDPVTYLLQDMHSAPIRGAFYEFELQQTKHPVFICLKKF